MPLPPNSKGEKKKSQVLQSSLILGISFRRTHPREDKVILRTYWKRLIETFRRGYGLEFFPTRTFPLIVFNKYLLTGYSGLSTVGETGIWDTTPSCPKTSPEIYAKCHFTFIKTPLMRRERSLPEGPLTKSWLQQTESWFSQDLENLI